MPLVFQYVDLELIFLSGCPNNGVRRRQWVPGHAEATLTGELIDGTPIEGTDSICIVP